MNRDILFKGSKARSKVAKELTEGRVSPKEGKEVGRPGEPDHERSFRSLQIAKNIRESLVLRVTR